MHTNSIKIKIVILLLCWPISSYASSLDTIYVQNQPLLYHKIESGRAEKKGLIIYMHGGVSQYKGMDNPRKVAVDGLLEGNTEFIPTFTELGYDVILPIAFNQFNWLEKEGETFVKTLVKKHRSLYKATIISGFSDGGTGAYRFFYNDPELFDALLMFNGFPQLSYFHRTVDYKKVTNKPVVFYSTSSDKVMPYEFMMMEFRRQQMLNEQTYFYLKSGDHSFKEYSTEDFKKSIRLMRSEKKFKPLPVDSDSMTLFPSIDGYIENGRLIELYPFRKKIARAFGIQEPDNARTDLLIKEYSKLLAKGSKIEILPVVVPKNHLENETITFSIVFDNRKQPVPLVNWLTIKT